MKAAQAHDAPPLSPFTRGHWPYSMPRKRQRKLWVTWYERHDDAPWEPRWDVLLPSGPFHKKRVKRMAGK